MRDHQRGWIDTSDAVSTALVLVYLAGVATMALIGWGIPWLWGVVKPLLHGLTG